MTEKQIQTAFDSNKNIFLTGPAGTGKTYRLNKYINSHENVLVCAPTGIAALNIGGETAHKVFHIPVPAYELPSFAKNKKGAITIAQLNIIANADTIIIDEISMCRNDVFRFIIHVIRKAEKIKGKKIRLIVSGDFSQLPPVVKKTEIKLLKKFKLDESGYAFTTPEWQSCNFKVIALENIKRQNNREFIDILNEIRVGNFIHMKYFDNFVNSDMSLDDDAIYICGTNAEADKLNQEYLDSITGNAVALQSYKTGHCQAGYVPDIIVIKPGARVIFTANDVMHNLYKNGTFGIVKYINSDNVVVTINDKDQTIYRKTDSIYSYSASSGKLCKKELGTVKQYPFKLGKAITIHKSQGQTFDKVVISPDIFAAGQLYVVLSRVTSPSGLTLLKPILPEYYIVDPTVQKFYKHDYKWPLAKTVKKLMSVAKKSVAKKSVAKKSVAKKSVSKKKPVRHKKSLKK